MNSRLPHWIAGAALVFTLSRPVPTFGDFPSPASSAILEDSTIRFCIDTSVTSPDFGKVVSVYDKEHHASIGTNTWFGLRAGRRQPMFKKVVFCSGDTLEIELGGFGVLSIASRFSYVLNNGALALGLKVWGSSKTEMLDGLYLDFATSLHQFSSRNQLCEPIEYDLDTLIGMSNHFNTTLRFSDSTNAFTVIVRNPFHSLFELNANGKKKHTLAILPCLPPNGVPGVPAAYSSIDANDTIYRAIEVYPGKRPYIPVFFGEHPDGLTSSMTMFWDELPNRDNWAYMTTDTASDTKQYRYFIKLLNAHPKMKMGFLLTPDRLLDRPLSHFQGWQVESPYVIPDTLEHSEGAASVLMLSDSIVVRRIYQFVPCKPNTDYLLQFSIMTQDVIGGGAYGEVYAGTRLIDCSSVLQGNHSWQKMGFTFTTSDSDTAIAVYLRMQDAKGTVFFDDAVLSPLGADTNLLVNGGFEQYTPGFMYDNRRRHWTDMHGPEYVVTKAPQSYRDFLKRIENHTMMYGWEDRAEIGCHGFHHTPSLYQPDPAEEFQNYDPYGDSLRIARIFESFLSIGLTKSSLRFWRTPGCEFTKSCIDLLVDSGAVFLDVVRGWNAGLFASRIQRGKNQLWIFKDTWWSDNIDGKRDSTDRLFSSQTQGHIGVIGGHPEFMFAEPYVESYSRLDDLFGGLERKYPDLGYVFPDEYADNANAIYALRIESIERSGSDIVFRFKGAARKGNTIAHIGSCSDAVLNGTKVDSRFAGGVTHIILPSTADTISTLVLKNAVDSLETTISGNGGLVRSPLRVPAGSGVRMEIFAVSGRRIQALSGVFPSENAARAFARQLHVPRGVYCVRISGGLMRGAQSKTIYVPE